FLLVVFCEQWGREFCTGKNLPSFGARFFLFKLCAFFLDRRQARPCLPMMQAAIDFVRRERTCNKPTPSSWLYDDEDECAWSREEHVHEPDHEHVLG
ncbi:unnamed protein product, partial [Amoebophrya sp. A120]